MTPTVLFYNLDNEKGRKLKVLCLGLKLRVRSVPPEEFGQTLDAVLGLAPKQEEPEQGEPFSEEMLVMAGLPPADEWLFAGVPAKKDSSGSPESGAHRD